jgi:hypothetical protein
MPLVMLLAPLFIVVVDLTRLRTVGGQTVTALTTGGLAVLLALAVLASAARSVDGTGTPAPLRLWYGWSLLTAALIGISYDGVQNLLTFTVFVACIVLSSRSFKPEHLPRFQRWMSLACWIFIIGNGARVFVLQSPSFYGARTAAIVGVLAIAWTSSLASYRRRAHVAPALLLVELAFSGSRTALALGIAILGIGSIAKNGRAARAVVLFGLGGIAFFRLASHWGPLHNRFVQGDNGYFIGGVALNTEGRAAVWRHLAEGWQLHPWVGSGLGAAQEITLRQSTTIIAQPHNDYLRLLVDQGTIGAVLFVLALLVMGYRSLRLAVRDVDHRFMHAAALSAIVGLMGCMFTDNPLVYIFVMAPAGIMIGASIGIGRTVSQEVTREPIKLDPLAVATFCLISTAVIVWFTFIR